MESQGPSGIYRFPVVHKYNSTTTQLQHNYSIYNPTPLQTDLTQSDEAHHCLPTQYAPSSAGIYTHKSTQIDTHLLQGRLRDATSGGDVAPRFLAHACPEQRRRVTEAVDEVEGEQGL